MNRFFREVLPPWVFIGAVVVGLLLTGGIILTVFLVRPGIQAAPVSTAQMVVLAAPTYTPPLPTAPPTPQPTSTPETPPTPLPANVQVGQLVQINGTGADGLRLREGPGLNSKILFVAIEAEVFQIMDGPVQADGYEWWYLASPYQSDYKGWAVSNYLSVSQQNP